MNLWLPFVTNLVEFTLLDTPQTAERGSKCWIPCDFSLLGPGEFRHCPWLWVSRHELQVQTLRLTKSHISWQWGVHDPIASPQKLISPPMPPQRLLHFPLNHTKNVSLLVYSLPLHSCAIVKANRQALHKTLQHHYFLLKRWSTKQCRAFRGEKHPEHSTSHSSSPFSWETIWAQVGRVSSASSAADSPQL